jgi:hypothetical protein
MFNMESFSIILGKGTEWEGGALRGASKYSPGTQFYESQYNFFSTYILSI